MVELGADEQRKAAGNKERLMRILEWKLKSQKKKCIPGNNKSVSLRLDENAPQHQPKHAEKKNATSPSP